MKNIQRTKIMSAVIWLLILAFCTNLFVLAQTPAPTPQKQGKADALFSEAFGLFQKGTADSYKAAVSKFEEASRLFLEVNDKKKAGQSLVYAGLSSSNSGMHKAAMEFNEKALKLARANEDKNYEAVILSNIGAVYSNLGDKQKALDYFFQALPIRKSISDKIGEAVTLGNIGFIYNSLNNTKQALKYYNEALTIHKSIGDERGTGITFNNIGQVYKSLDDPTKALEFYQKAITSYKAAGNKSGEAAALSNIGTVYLELGENQKALDYFNKSRDFFEDVGDQNGEALTLFSIAQIYDVRGEKQKALQYFNMALTLRKITGDKAGEAAVLNGIGVVYNALGEKQKALEYYASALVLAKAVGDKSAEAFILNNAGFVYKDLGENKKALDYLTQALTIIREVGYKRGEATFLTNIGKIYKSTGDYEKALNYHKQALIVSQSIGFKYGEAAIFYDIGAAYDAAGDAPKALEFYNKSLPVRKAVKDKNGEAATLSNIMLVWKNTEVPRLAIFYGKQAVNIYQQLRTNIQGLDKNIQKTYLGTIEETYRNLADILIAQGRIAEAEQVLAMLKEDEYFSYLRRDDAVADDLKGRISLSPDEKKAFEDYEKFSDEITRSAEEFGALEKKKNALNLGESLSVEDQKQYDLLKSKYDSAVTVFNKYLDDLKVKFSENDKRVATVESDTQGLLKKLGQPRTVIISTIVGEDRLNLIVTTSDIQKAHTVEVKAADLNKLVAEFRDAVKNPNVDPRPLGKKLYDKLFPAALQKDLRNIKADTIVWSLDGTLRYVPMAALWDGEKYLVERFQNAVLTLASRDKLSRSANENRQKWLALGVGVSKKFETFNELPAVPKELCSVVDDPKKKEFCDKFGEDGVFSGLMLTDDEFTLADFTNNLGKTPIVHIASHFSLNAGDFEDSYLLLGGGNQRRFSLDELKKTRLDNIELLTLSACNTAMTSGANSSGIEVEGFGALAQKQGVKSVLATLWAVADDSTGELMTEFYKILETKPTIGKAEALKMAQIKMINGKYEDSETTSKNRSDKINLGGEGADQPKFETDKKAPFAHPYYWSPFVLIGNWK